MAATAEMVSVLLRFICFVLFYLIIYTLLVCADKVSQKFGGLGAAVGFFNAWQLSFNV
ncbi:PTS system N-acetylglucosamine-specific IIABC component [Prevotella dentalis DSM 3688]|uniref:PTS system N-acetylglucosamine-specific IIABC component n=1 Tax=Prevotella dentalis (strain ATCC 49559 / DSM 3688 / JCM 13448 / NCTC 12043 / ES 2772) TaxID=908937 RepID=F9D1T8_PREDD|nr:PTS system N-acetylglucosamine-specific IIABC component [Prevotella dentalis DSM 3688]